MVIRVDVVEAALRERYGGDPVTSAARAGWSRSPPGGRQFDDALATELAGEEELTLLCGRYEGFDERVHEHLATDVVSIGPYVLAGGELAAMVVVRRGPAQAPGRARPRGERASRSPSARRSRARPSTRTTRGRPSGAGTPCRRSCSRATTGGCASGGSSRAARAGALSADLGLRYHSRPRDRPRLPSRPRLS